MSSGGGACELSFRCTSSRLGSYALIAMSEAKKQFEAVFPSLVNELEEIVSETRISKDAVEWFKANLVYNTLGGKANRGLSVIDTYRLLVGKAELSPEEYKRAAVLGWCVELLQAFFLVADDIMDSSKTRRGQPCWYLNPKVGMIAINDSFMLESAIYVLLKKYFKKESYYVDLIELFHEVTFQTELGQLLDLITAPEDDVDLSKFSLEKHSYIVTYKTAFYSFYLPVALAMHMAGIANTEDLQQAKGILLPLGEYFQVQDDYLDCYGDPEFIGKIGTDIQDNKCGWVINKALQQASPVQRKILDENYGRKDAKCEQTVKRVFAELNIEQDYLDYEETIVAQLRKKIAAVDESRGFKGEVLEAFLKKIYKRQK
jgi:farnesyl diphosphate synthase